MPRAKLEKFANQVLACAGITTAQLTGKTILDAGCGTGEMTCSMGIHAKKILGIDVSAESIHRAQKLAQTHHVNSVTFQHADILSFHTNEKFDLVTSFGVLHHTRDPKKGFENLVRTVKQDGMLVTGYYHPWGGWKQRLEKFISRIVAGKDPEKRIDFMQRFSSKQKTEHERIFLADRVANPREKYYRVQEIIDWYHENGFEIVGVQGHKPKMNVKNVHDAISILFFELELFFGAKRFFIVAGKKVN